MKGIYVLVISITKNVNLDIGSLGNVHFRKGLYFYVGSAQSNLEKRVERHLRKKKRTFWHVDYLLKDNSTAVIAVYYKGVKKVEECNISNSICRVGIPVEGFGSSDCRCTAHLFKVADINALKECVHKTIPERRRRGGGSDRV